MDGAYLVLAVGADSPPSSQSGLSHAGLTVVGTAVEGRLLPSDTTREKKPGLRERSETRMRRTATRSRRLANTGMRGSRWRRPASCDETRGFVDRPGDEADVDEESSVYVEVRCGRRNQAEIIHETLVLARSRLGGRRAPAATADHQAVNAELFRQPHLQTLNNKRQRPVQTSSRRHDLFAWP